MTKTLPLLLLAPALLAQSPTVAGEWLATVEFSFPINDYLELSQQGDKLTGYLGKYKLEGTLTGDSLHFLTKDGHGSSEELFATVQSGIISGTLIFVDRNDANDKQPPTTHRFTATLVPQQHSGTPQRHEFTPSTFYRQFSAATKPVLNVSPGDTIHTGTVDAGGTDEKGVARFLGGNPETGPFYIETAAPGDTLVVHLTRLNRDGANIWVASIGSNNVTKLLASTGATVGTYAVGFDPFGVAFDGANIWVVNQGSNNVTKLLASTGATVGTYAVGGSPSGVTFDGANIWVVNQVSGSVTKLLASTGATVSTYAVGQLPRAVAFDGVNIWVATQANGIVIKLLASSGATVGTYTAGTSPVGVAFDGTNIWVTNTNSKNVTKISPAAQ